MNDLAKLKSIFTSSVRYKLDAMTLNGGKVEYLRAGLAGRHEARLLSECRSERTEGE